MTGDRMGDWEAWLGEGGTGNAALWIFTSALESCVSQLADAKASESPRARVPGLGLSHVTMLIQQAPHLLGEEANNDV